MFPCEILLCPTAEAVTVVGDSTKHCHLVPRVRGLYRRIRPDLVPATSLYCADVLGVLIDDNDGFLGQFRPVFYCLLKLGFVLRIGLVQQRVRVAFAVLNAVFFFDVVEK